MIPEMEYIRMAAFIDGEGCIRINRTNKRKRHDLKVILVNTDPRLAVWAHRNFGGCVYRMYMPQERISTDHPRFVWELSGTSASALLDKCYPYLILKREEAEIGLTFQATKTSTWGAGKNPNKGVPPEVKVHRDELYEKMRLIKTKRPTLEEAEGVA